MISILLVVLTAIVYLIKTLDFIYLFQIKEYRWDRFKSLLKEEGFFHIFYSKKVHLPAKKVRNLIIVLFSLTFLLISIPIIQKLDPVIQLIILIFLPLIVLLIVSLGVGLSSILVRIYRNRLIKEANRMISNSKTIFIGITGSYGKTSTKEFLYQILSKKFNVAKTDANMNSDIGVALSVIKNLKKDTQFFIAEMGAYRKGEIAKICQFTHPKYSILTGIGNQHLDLFGSKENLIEAKKELFYSLPKEGIGYINKDMADYEKFINGLKCKIISYSTEKEAEIITYDIQESFDQIKTTIKYQTHQFEVSVHLLGKHNLENLLPCVALSIDLGLNEKEIIEALKAIKPLKNKLSLQKGIKSSTILNDSNNSNIEGFLTAIQTASKFPQRQKIIISKGIIELGKEKEKSYKKIIQELSDKDLILYTTDDLFKKLDSDNKVKFFTEEDDLLKDLTDVIDEQSLIIIEGKFTPSFILFITNFHA